MSEEAERPLPYRAVELFDLAADLERYPQYLPGWISAQVYLRGPDVCHAEQVVGFGPVRMRLRTVAHMYRPERIEVTSDDSRFRQFHLLWRFRQAGGDCSVGLRVELELRSRLLQSWVDRGAHGTVAQVLRAFEARARQLYGPAR